MKWTRLLVTLQETGQNGRFSPLFHSLLALILAIAFYGRSLTFAFFNDDPTGNFAWLEGQTIWSLFGSAAGYGFYRPVGFALWQGLLALAGDYHAFLFHALSLLLHGVNAALLWQLAYWLSRRRSYSWAVVALFITFPFNYEAVAYVAALFHPLTAFWTLLALTLYRQYQRQQQRGYLLAVHLVLLLGLFSHENGLFIPAALALWIWHTELGQDDSPVAVPYLAKILGKVWPFGIGALLFVLVWLVVPKAGESSLPTLAGIAQNLIPFAQTAVYPLLPFIPLDAGQPLALLGLALLVMAGLGLVARQTGGKAYGRLWLWGLGWFLLASLPSLLFLEPGYVLGSPRLHYLPEIGVAMLWGLPLLALGQMKAWLPRLGLQLALLLVLILPPRPFIQCQLDFYAQASQIVRGMAQATNATPPGQTAVFVNIPFFFASYSEHPDGCPNPYPWTPEGVVIMPLYAGASDFARINGGAERPTRSLTVPDYGPGWVTHGTEEASAADLRQLVGETAVFIFDLPSGEFVALHGAWQPQIIERPGLAEFGGLMGLVETAVHSQPGVLQVNLTWQARAATDRAYTLFVHLYDDGGQIISQNDGPPVQGYLPTPWWQPGDQIQEARDLYLPDTLPPGAYTLAVGVYDSQEGQRLPAVHAGQPLADDLYRFSTLIQSADERPAD
jgi:hypothetical protein